MHRTIIPLLVVVFLVGCSSPRSGSTATGYHVRLAEELSVQIDVLSEELAKPSPDFARCQMLIQEIRSKAAESEDQAQIIDAILRHLNAVNRRTLDYPQYSSPSPPYGYGYGYGSPSSPSPSPPADGYGRGGSTWGAPPGY